MQGTSSLDLIEDSSRRLFSRHDPGAGAENIWPENLWDGAKVRRSALLCRVFNPAAFRRCNAHLCHRIAVCPSGQGTGCRALAQCLAALKIVDQLPLNALGKVVKPEPGKPLADLASI